MWRLSWRMQRFELRLLIGAALVLAVAMLAIAWQVRAVRSDELACLAAAPPAVEGSSDGRCLEFLGARDLLDRATLATGAGALLAPFVLGLFLGVPIVAREVEHRTAAIAWSLSASRRRWLVGRAAPILVAITVAGLSVGMAGEVLMRSAPWNEGVDASFDFYGSRGPLVPARALAVGALGLAVGAVVPRQLPAVLVGGGLLVAFAIGLAVVTDEWMRDATVPVPMAATQGAARIYDMGVQDDATGELISLEEAYAEHPELMETGEAPGLTMIAFVVPGTAYDTFVWRETAILAGGAVLALALATLVVGVRRS